MMTDVDPCLLATVLTNEAHVFLFRTSELSRSLALAQAFDTCHLANVALQRVGRATS